MLLSFPAAIRFSVDDDGELCIPAAFRLSADADDDDGKPLWRTPDEPDDAFPQFWSDDDWPPRDRGPDDPPKLHNTNDILIDKLIYAIRGENKNKLRMMSFVVI